MLGFCKPRIYSFMLQSEIQFLWSGLDLQALPPPRNLQSSSDLMRSRPLFCPEELLLWPRSFLLTLFSLVVVIRHQHFNQHDARLMARFPWSQFVYRYVSVFFKFYCISLYYFTWILKSEYKELTVYCSFSRCICINMLHIYIYLDPDWLFLGLIPILIRSKTLWYGFIYLYCDKGV